ncbi:S49 family peptidase [Kingella negevensis]|uniref:S49 family peptidase n=1 Tax=Kingella negevensis TaxID=1522312 RepID=UPI002542A90E|nr:S49 family peptidase [Kingella negevensis]WII93512.1 S49 family peptidase [Kingella negevensis]
MTYRIRRPNSSGDNSSPIEPRSTNMQTIEDERWAQRTLREVLMQAYEEQRRTRFWRNIWRGVWVVLFLMFVAALKTGGKDSSNRANSMAALGKEHTAVVRLEGEIGGENDQVAVLRKGMEAAYKNGKAKAIIIHANSPGGSPVVSNIAFAEIRRMKSQHVDIPIYVVTQDMCASGCYYIAAAADKIYADPSSLVGSIGVIGSSFDATGLMDKLGVKRRVRIAGNNKGMGDPFTAETPEQAAIWQQMLAQIHDEFIKAVREGRGKKLQEGAYPDLFSGRVFTGIEAKKVGLIDEFGNVYSVARDVVKAPELVDYTPEDDDFAKLMNRYFGAKAEAKLSELVNKIW